jgi:hypothetical protein
MASVSEVGHAKNLANLQKLIDLVQQIGATYNPNNPQLTAANLIVLQTLCTGDYNNWLTKYTTWKSATNNREIAFHPINKLCTQILDNVKTLNIPQQTIDDVAAIVHKIHGNSSQLNKESNTTTPTTSTPTGGTPTPTGGGSTPTTSVTQAPASDKTIGTPTPLPNPIVIPPADGVSTSQQSYDSLLANFEKLIQQIQAMPSYTPNEVNIKLATLQTLNTNLQSLNLAAINATNAIGLARNQRNLSFYAIGTGMIDITKKVKSYIRQIEGSTSPVYHQATALKFVSYISRRKKKNK